jgi:hypothetical protein
MFLGHPVDHQGLVAPERVGIHTYASFHGSQSYQEGGDPTNDFERLELLSSGTIERNAIVPRDYRVLIGTGPFDELGPGQSLVIQAALAVGEGLSDLVNTAASAQLAYNGQWFNLDGNPLTGIDRREDPVPGPVTVIIDSCRAELSNPVFHPGRDPIWINRDCAREEFYKTSCSYLEADSMMFRTGVGGREAQIHWIPGQEAPVPAAVASFQAAPGRTGIHLSWELSVTTGVIGFNMYRQEKSGQPLQLLNTNGLIPAERRTFVDRNVRTGRTYRYVLGLVRSDNSELRSDLATASIPSLSLELHQNYPNPFNPSTMVSFTLPERTRVNLSVYDLDGRLVKTLLDGSVPEGFKEVRWNGTNQNGTGVASGIYLLRLKAGNKSLTRKMMLLK